MTRARWVANMFFRTDVDWLRLRLWSRIRKALLCKGVYSILLAICQWQWMHLSLHTICSINNQLLATEKRAYVAYLSVSLICLATYIKSKHHGVGLLTLTSVDPWPVWWVPVCPGPPCWFLRPDFPQCERQPPHCEALHCNKNTPLSQSKSFLHGFIDRD